MAKTKQSSGPVGKITFGKSKRGKYKKKYGPKEQKPKSYRGQGR